MPKLRNEKIITENNIKTFEKSADPKLENRMAANGLETVFLSNNSNENEQSTNFISEDDVKKVKKNTSDSLLLTPKKTKNDGKLEEVNNQEKENTDKQDEERTTTSASINEELLNRIIDKNNPKHYHYQKIIKEYLARDVYEGKSFRLFAYWRALAYGVTLSVEDAFAILFHLEDASITHKLSEELGNILGLDYLSTNLAETLIQCIKATTAYKDEIKEKGRDAFGRMSAGLVDLVTSIQTYLFFDPKSLTAINGFAKSHYFDPVIKAIKKFFKKNGLLQKPSKDAADSINTAIDSINFKGYQDDPNVNEMVDKILKIIGNYFNFPIKLAANRPGMISSKLKKKVRDHVNEFLKTFLFGNSEKPTKNQFIEINGSYYFIARVENAKDDKIKYVLMKIENIALPEAEPFYAIMNIAPNDVLFDNITIGQYGRDYFIKNIIKHDEKHYFIFEKSNQSPPVEFYAKLITADNGTTLQVIDDKTFHQILKEKQDSNSMDNKTDSYIYPSYQFGEKILPNDVITLLADFLNHRVMGKILNKLADKFKQDLLKDWKVDTDNIPEHVEKYIKSLRDKLWLMLCAAFVEPMKKIASFLPDKLQDKYPHTIAEQNKLIQNKLSKDSVGINYITWFILTEFILDASEHQHRFFGSEFAFLDSQDKTPTHIQDDSNTKVTGPNINKLAEYHYELLKNLAASMNLTKEEFYSFVLMDMLRNHYPVDIIMKEIKENMENLKINEIFKTSDKTLMTAAANTPLNVIQVAYLEQNKSFFEYFYRSLSHFKKIPIGKKEIIDIINPIATNVMDPQDEFYTKWFPEHIGKVTPTSVPLMLFKTNGSKQNMTPIQNTSGETVGYEAEENESQPKEGNEGQRKKDKNCVLM